MENPDPVQGSKKPLQNSAEQNRFLPLSRHLLVLQKLELAIRLKRGLNILVGAAGTGKTTLCRKLLETISGDEQVDTYFISEPDFNSPHALLIRLANLFAIANPEHLTQWQCKEAIKDFLFCKGVDRSRIQALIIDQGHRLDPDCLEVLRELMNYETNDYKLLQIVIAGRPEIEKRLQTMPNLVDRINLFLRLGPFGFKQTRALIGFQLAALAPGDQPALCLSKPSCWMTHWASGGVPSSIVDLCRHTVRNFDSAKNRRHIGLWQFIRAYRAASDDDSTRETPTGAEPYDPGNTNDTQ